MTFEAGRERIGGEGPRKPPQHNLLKRFFKRPTHLNAIKAMCFECVGGTANKLPDGGWKEMIRNCGADGFNGHECPLYRYRPYRMKGE